MKTYGWDTVFVISADRVNQMLSDHAGTTVLDFATTLPNMPDAPASGTFAPWQLVDGGSNDIVHIALPIKQGSLTYNGTAYDLHGLTLVVATYLDWLSQETSRVLQFDYQRLGDGGAPPSPGELSVIELRDPNQQLPVELNALLSYALGSYLVAQAEQVRFIFATVNLVPPGTNSWLTPRQSAYCYVRREDSDRSFLAILSVTTDRPIHDLQRTVDAAALPQTGNAAFVISNELFLLSVVVPGLCNALSTTPDAFSYDSGSGLLRNTRRLWTKTVRSGAIDYHPWIDTLEVFSGEGALQGHYAGGTDLYAGISMTYTIDTRNPAGYDPGAGALTLNPDPSPHESHEADIPWWWFIGGLIVIAVVEIVVKVISDDLAAQIAADGSDRLALGKHPPSSILWGSDTTFKVTTMQLDSAVIVVGNV